MGHLYKGMIIRSWWRALTWPALQLSPGLRRLQGPKISSATFVTVDCSLGSDGRGFFRGLPPAHLGLVAVAPTPTKDISAPIQVTQASCEQAGFTNESSALNLLKYIQNSHPPIA
jgi:hypothetical protein